MGMLQGHKKEDGRKNNGGARKGAGRPLGPVNKAFVDYMAEEIVVKEFSHGQVRRVKKQRQIALLNQLAIMGIRDKNIKAIKTFFDIVRGKATMHEKTKKPRRGRPPKIAYSRAMKLAYAEYLRRQ